MREPVRRNFHLGSGEEGRRRLASLEAIANRLGIEGQHGPGLSRMIQMLADGELYVGKTDSTRAMQKIQTRIDELKKEVAPVQEERERLTSVPVSEMDTGAVQANALHLARLNHQINGLQYARNALSESTRFSLECWLGTE